MKSSRRLPVQSLPPRAVPLSIRLRVLFGGMLNQVGWFLIGIGLVFCYVFAAQADVSFFLFTILETGTVNASVTHVEPTNASEGDDAYDNRIYAVDYQYVARGSAYSGRSYVAGPLVSDGNRVTVEYLTLNPAFSRIRGMRRAVFGASAVLVVVFPLIGAGFLFSGVREGIKGNRLLSRGRWAMGTLVSTEATGASINRRPVLRLTFEFRAQKGGLFHVVSKTHEPEALEDEAQEPVLYDPIDPSVAVALDGLPGSPEFDDAGNILPGNPWRTFLVLLIPALTVLGHGVFLLSTWMH